MDFATVNNFSRNYFNKTQTIISESPEICLSNIVLHSICVQKS